jgi:hypothetical protein
MSIIWPDSYQLARLALPPACESVSSEHGPERSFLSEGFGNYQPESLAVYLSRFRNNSAAVFLSYRMNSESSISSVVSGIAHSSLHFPQPHH